MTMLFFSNWWFLPVHHLQVALLLAAVVVSAQVSDPALSLSNERSSIERTYELTKYLEHQLREIKDTYLSYLGPPFSDPDFSPPRPNTTALSLPSAATRLDLWRGLENRARLAQNHRAYSVLLGAVRELARATLCPYLQSSLLHFSAGLDGLLGSISGLMTTLGTSLLHPPSLNDFSRKVESFWVLRELQSWLWRSAKDFNRLKKKLRA
ncbi:hypothetical protein ANANG_G00139190 [Anguilla anguilla]|uniref:Cardiotrophin-like cytokine factor 1 n=1 Tax=Anguilla anguilla TaxID=7936 RepID=A0A9D3MAF4_ANGAN|nr:hypothetical protein ANANG_G00139190 [Anguilla anguilla]